MNLLNQKVLNQSIQLVAFDNPFPPDYGGAIDVFFQLKTLSEYGVKVDLHLFVYGNRKDYSGLFPLCNEVFFYQRDMSVKAAFSSKPFIVKSRKNKELLENLKKNPNPVLFQGLHCCAFLDHPDLKNHLKIVRTHNIEHDYYEGLQKSSDSFFKKIYFNRESRKLRKFEPVLKHTDLIFAITEKDGKHFEQYAETIWIPPFSQSFKKVEKTEEYILFHGNLSVEENINALVLLTENVFKHIDIPVVVAGKTEEGKLRNILQDVKNVTLIENPSKEKMEELITKARCHILYTEQNTGVKLKLIHAIQTSGHIVLNRDMLFDDSFSDEVELASSWDSIIKLLKNCFYAETVKPRPRLRQLFDNWKNAEKMLETIFKTEVKN